MTSQIRDELRWINKAYTLNNSQHMIISKNDYFIFKFLLLSIKTLLLHLSKCPL